MPDLLGAVDVTEAFRFVDVAGVFCNGAIGATIARRRKFDVIGFTVLGVVSGLAGGVIRDVMLQVGQPVALTDPAYLVTALLGVLAATLIKMDGRTWQWPLAVVDALALGCWAATGTIKAQITGLGMLASVLLGVITAIGGGMVRDVCIGQVPAVLGGNTLYATAAVAASTSILLVPPTQRPTLGMAIGIAVGSALTLIARWRKWTLPVDADVGVTLSPRQMRKLIRRSVRAGVRQERRRALAASAEGAEGAARGSDPEDAPPRT